MMCSVWSFSTAPRSAPLPRSCGLRPWFRRQPLLGCAAPGRLVVLRRCDLSLSNSHLCSELQCPPAPLSPTRAYTLAERPTMHHMILAFRRGREDEIERYPLRFIANASGGLPEALADDLREEFECPVLPCYGMTECIPISSPPMLRTLPFPASSGKVLGPRLRIVGEDGKLLGCGVVGEIVIKGQTVMGGYEHDDGAACAVGEAWLHGGWFRTGDMGFVNETGWLTLTGRRKEVVNRAGEIISPME
eukprot:2996613-Rhodomonas_salina.1